MPPSEPTSVREPTIALLTAHALTLPPHIPARSVGEASDAERLVEFVARVRHQSVTNPADRPTREFVRQLVAHQDDALAHAHVVLFVEGVSRGAIEAASRAGDGLSVTSVPTRSVEPAAVRFVVPVDMRADATREAAWLKSVASAWHEYLACIDAMMDHYPWMDNKVQRRRRAFDAAASLLPDGIEAKSVVSGSVAHVRVALLRWGREDRDLELRGLAIAVWRTLHGAMPAIFGDLAAYVAADRYEALRGRYNES